MSARGLSSEPFAGSAVQEDPTSSWALRFAPPGGNALSVRFASQPDAGPQLPSRKAALQSGWLARQGLEDLHIPVLARSGSTPTNALTS